MPQRGCFDTSSPQRMNFLRYLYALFQSCKAEKRESLCSVRALHALSASSMSEMEVKAMKNILRKNFIRMIGNREKTGKAGKEFQTRETGQSSAVFASME